MNKRQPQSITGWTNKMKTIRTKVYQFNELSKAAKEVAIEYYREINVDSEHWYSGIYDDAETIGLKITEFDFDSASFVRNVKGEFITSAGEVVEDILVHHGKECDTYKLATRYKNAFQLTSSEEDEDTLSDREDLFLSELLNEYKHLLQQEYDYQSSDKAIMETIEANEYYFTKDGKRFNQ